MACVLCRSGKGVGGLCRRAVCRAVIPERNGQVQRAIWLCWQSLVQKPLLLQGGGPP